MAAPTTIYTRKQYLDHDCTHAEYYLSIALEIGIGSGCYGPGAERVREALAAGDERLNTIPLATWDRFGEMLCLQGTTLKAAMAKRGDYTTMAGLVCLLKTAAIHAAETQQAPSA